MGRGGYDKTVTGTVMSRYVRVEDYPRFLVESNATRKLRAVRWKMPHGKMPHLE